MVMAATGLTLARDGASSAAHNKALTGYELKTRLHEEEAKNALVVALGEDDCEGCKI